MITWCGTAARLCRGPAGPLPQPWPRAPPQGPSQVLPVAPPTFTFLPSVLADRTVLTPGQNGVSSGLSALCPVGHVCEGSRAAWESLPLGTPCIGASKIDSVGPPSSRTPVLDMPLSERCASTQTNNEISARETGATLGQDSCLSSHPTPPAQRRAKADGRRPSTIFCLCRRDTEPSHRDVRRSGARPAGPG